MSDTPPLYQDRVSFSIGTGRCGTRLLQELLSREPGISAVHERNELNETFHRYCKWYRLPVDDEGFLHVKEQEIRQDLSAYRHSHEASAFLSLSVLELYERFGARFILLVRSPEGVVNSYARKGWYEQPIVRADPNLALGYQQRQQAHHFFGRIVPSGDEFLEWQTLTRVGKLAWYWNALNQAVLKQFEKLPQSHYRVLKLEALDYACYRELTRFLGFETRVKEGLFEQIVASRPNRLPKVVTVSDWSAEEIADFERLVEPMARLLGFAFRVAELVPDPRTLTSTSRTREHLYDLRIRWRAFIKRFVPKNPRRRL